MRAAIRAINPTAGQMSRLVVVSNRLPFTVENDEQGKFQFTPSAGGLVSALGAYIEGRRQTEPEFDCLWVGWPGSVVPEQNEDAVRDLALGQHGALPVFLSADEVHAFYHGFCNNTLWPLFHYFPSYTDYDPRHFDVYVSVNRRFADAISAVLRPDDTLWIHDYQLLLLPGMLRTAAPQASIGFFLHIPFPSHELFRLLPSPWRRELLAGMLGADLVGFHTFDYTQHFLQCVSRTLGYEHHLGQLAVGTQARRAETFPIGIDFERFMTAAESSGVAQRRTEIERGIGDRRAIFSVDRLDYTKGIITRLRAYEEFLASRPEWLGKVVFLLTVVPSRAEVPQYRRMKQALDERVGRINGRFGSTEWVPIVYQYRSLDFETLVALYELSPVALITPLRDGMNLVAKEYLASKPDGSGVLILSEMAGAARELGEALLVNPNHQGEIVAALEQALTMSQEEQLRRNRPMQERLRSYDAKRWATHFLSTLAGMKAEQRVLAARYLTPDLADDIRRRYEQSERRLIFLDYDGTLVPFASAPDGALPDPPLLALLARLCEDPANHVYLISGRDRATLSRWFDGIPLNFVAEHGAWIRRRGSDWELYKPLSSAWKERLLPILRGYADQLAGALLEEKEFSLAFHYRRCDPELGAQRATQLTHELTQFTANFAVQVLQGKKVVEVRNAGVTKGAAAAQIAAERDHGFVLAIGDDETDEDLFRALPPAALSIRVGTPFSHAQFSVDSYLDVRRLLTNFSSSARPAGSH
ncbi:MAG TPA: bifunctional alpha,alpha-trehalose-phosphate synthase (UDP-forming)/trehalose-phosphatase [Polyangiaceae bacterium]|nr:bifunctional alpha,alpha-trehalose-phosphate synthase (UDP-forming)/trehalose-phosphatase [Polyangiaceae bacterium]